MRNYLKMRAMFWNVTGPVSSDLGAVGKDDEQLLEYVLKAEAFVRLIFGNTCVFHRTPPVTIYYELNATNLAVLLNWTDYGACRSGLEATSARTSTGVFSGFTVLESPRKTWSHGH